MEQGEQDSNGSGFGMWPAWLVLAFFLAGSLLLRQAAVQQVEADQRRQFERRTQQVRHTLETHIAAYEQIIRSAAALFAASDEVSREDWRVFVESLGLKENYPAILAMAYARRVTGAQLDDFVRQVQASGVPEFAVRPAGRRDVHVVNVYSEPYAGVNVRALGYDMWQDEMRRRAMEQALDTGKPAVTEKVVLKVDEERNPMPAFIMYMPVRSHVNGELTGFVLIPLRMAMLVQQLPRSTTQGVAVTIYDGEHPSAANLFYREATATAERPSRFAARETIRVAGRIWTLDFASSVELDSAAARYPLYVLFTGLLVSFLLFAIIWSVASTRRRAVRIAGTMTRSLRENEQRLASVLGNLEVMVAQRTGELNAIFDALPDLYFRIDRDGVIRDYRAGSKEDLYVPPEAFLNRRMQEILPAHAVAKIEQAMARVLTGESPAIVEYELPFPVGEQVFEARILPLAEDQLIAVVRNITQRRSIENELLRAKGEAERLAHVKSNFLANMSHELRTPLNGVLGMANIGRRQAAGNPQLQEVFDKILNSGKLLLGIINDVLDYSKIEAGMLKIDATAVDLPRLIDETVELVGERAAAKGLALEVVRAPGLPEACMLDSLRLRQVLLNLLSNAIKFTETGQVTLAVAREGMQIVLRVDDTGIGMSEEEIARIFDPFEQADTSTTRRFGGTGLGLAIVQRLVALMEGELRVTSAPGTGSSFEVRLPLVPAALSAVLADTAVGTPAPERLAGLRILLVEDNPLNQFVMQDNLAHEGSVVTVAGSGEDAVERVRQAGPAGFDLVLMDVQMPGIDGYEATRRILKVAPGLPVVGQTAHVMAEERAACFAAGMVAHLAKPVDPEELVATVRRHARRPAAG